MRKDWDDANLGGENAEWRYTIVDLSVDAGATIRTGPTILGKIYVQVVMSAHTVAVLDGAVTVGILPASGAAGSALTALEGTRFGTSLVITPNASSTGTIVVQWRETE